MTVLLHKPSEFLSEVKVDQCSDWTRLKFNRSLQNRQAVLLDKREQGILSNEECIELDAIEELAVIFSFINGQMAHQRRNYLR